MCDHCHPVSRRDVIKGAAAGFAATLLASCATDVPVNELPDPYHEHLVDEFGPPVRIDRSRIVVPRAAAPQPTEYGFIMPRSAWTNTRSPCGKVRRWAAWRG
jgi:hypothetical protein